MDYTCSIIFLMDAWNKFFFMCNQPNADAVENRTVSASLLVTLVGIDYVQMEITAFILVRKK